MKSINWKDHLVNLIVVITGISIAFWLNNWSQASKEKNLQRTYKEFMLSDLEQDLQELDSLIFEDSINSLFYRQMLFNFKSLSEDSINQAVTRLATLNTFAGHNVTFESLKSSGKFELVDFELRLGILEYYHQGYTAMNEVEEYYKMNFDNSIIPFLMGKIDISNGGMQVNSLDSKEFKIMLRLHLGLLQQKLDISRNNRKGARQLMHELNENLKQ